MKQEDKQIPDTSDAEEWLDADTFKWHGKLWRLESNQVKELENNSQEPVNTREAK